MTPINGTEVTTEGVVERGCRRRGGRGHVETASWIILCRSESEEQPRMGGFLQHCDDCMHN